MPLPKPNPKEEKNDFVSRCMSSDVMKKEYPDDKQRVAICYSQYKRRKHAKGSEPNWEECETDNLLILF